MVVVRVLSVATVVSEEVARVSVNLVEMEVSGEAMEAASAEIVWAV
jgi:hypothetical protein